MKYAQFIKALKDKGVGVENAKRHTILRYKGKMTTISRHPSQEVIRATIVRIVKKLGVPWS